MRDPLRLGGPRIKPLRPQDHFLGSLHRHAVLGLIVVAVLVLGLGGWVALAQVESAVIAQGIVVVEGGSRKVQHPEGGIVREILVADNDEVTTGQLLVRLDDVFAQAELGVMKTQLREALGTSARLSAESVGSTSMTMLKVAGVLEGDPLLEQVLVEQLRLLMTRKQSLDSSVSRIKELMTEKEALIAGQEAQITAYSSQLDIVTEELGQLETLTGQALVSNQRVNDVRLSKAEIEGQLAGVRSAIASTQSSIAELRLQSEQTVSDFRSQALVELQRVSQTIAEVSEKIIAAEARLARLEIRAPVDGIVHESSVHTVGGVVSPADVLMLIVPRAVHLVVDLRVRPTDVTRLHVGQPADVRLLSFDTRSTPLLVGKVDAIAPDLLRDPVTGMDYFSVRVDVADEELINLPADAQLTPGMPAEGFFQTGARSVWSYLMGPIEERFLRTFREG
ncbi:HlyD family type I secretion periplasmic adaptor subunit [Devosia sp. SD17-2]|uniref:HlyD family type I secretion periplasmic adaptor subunit n=1 Tax=Devosia sp. SD17-2 TaxID=2976459 RepID=UPI0023D8024B|nr:HlyD family type I secretion periplasmic adaptor subunit [Devosia sp. SD17-2]WEJ34190.1 HlyD family type I secretion periplasmic adaptor subunit [Devosia sp. SD17-2]